MGKERERGRAFYASSTTVTCIYQQTSIPIPQSLFHIPRFCQLILSYHPPPLSSEGGDSDAQEQYPHCVIFVLELQKLFAFLHHSQRKYISPDLAIQVKNCCHGCMKLLTMYLCKHPHAHSLSLSLSLFRTHS